MCVMEQVELLVSIVLRAVIVVAVILATLVVTIYVLTVLGLDERRAGELGVALSLAIVVYLVLQATAGSHPTTDLKWLSARTCTVVAPRQRLAPML